jgi:hypothetical protein
VRAAGVLCEGVEEAEVGGVADGVSAMDVIVTEDDVR